MSTCANRTTDHTARPVVPDEPGRRSTSCHLERISASMRVESDPNPGTYDRTVEGLQLGGCSDRKAPSHSSCRDGGHFGTREAASSSGDDRVDE